MKTVLITGENRGIGLEFCRQYAADGWRVLACSRYPEKSDALNKLPAQYPELIKKHALDVADHVQIERLAQALADQSIDLLINNAGIYLGSDKAVLAIPISRNGSKHSASTPWRRSRWSRLSPRKSPEASAKPS